MFIPGAIVGSSWLDRDLSFKLITSINHSLDKYADSIQQLLKKCHKAHNMRIPIKGDSNEKNSTVSLSVFVPCKC